jgi:spore germination protein KA
MTKEMTSVSSQQLQQSLTDNVQYIQNAVGNSNDVVIRKIELRKNKPIKAAIIFTDGLVDSRSLQAFISEALLWDHDSDIRSTDGMESNPLHTLKSRILAVGDIKDITEFDSLLKNVLSGDAILLLDGYASGFSIGIRGGKDRGVTESTSESVVRGPKESFSENLRTNTSLIRRKIKNPQLWLEMKQIGKVTKTDVAIMYIKEIVNEQVVKEVHERLDRIDIDGILESGYIEEWIQDESYTPFPTVYNSERPDVIAAELLEGKVAIIIDGTPIVLIVPALFISFMQASEDYYERADISTLLRILRFISLFIALLGPSLYIAVTTFHQEMLPTSLLVSLAAQREGVPFPAFLEALFMEIAFEILREAGLRMPRTIAQAISVVGTLVIGTAAVEAGIVSAGMVIVVAITAISSFVLPAFAMSMSIRMLRFPMMVLGASFGLFGLLMGLIALILHLCSLRSFGIPYMSPFAPLVTQDLKDTLWRVPWKKMNTRVHINQKNIQRQKKTSPEPKS